VFKRRIPRTNLEALGRALWPRGGWARASRYVMHRLQRLPDPAYKIARGIAAGVFTSFTPFFGLHFLISAGIAWGIRGNVLAALLATFFGNPLTFPIIATLSVELGAWMLGHPHVPPRVIFESLTNVPLELWQNLATLVTGGARSWSQMHQFFDYVFLPYLVGGLLPGLVSGVAAFFLTRPVITAYQRGRMRRIKARFEKQRAAELARRRGHAKG
jgi:uncharacterized protein (DUF2062 family)